MNTKKNRKNACQFEKKQYLCTRNQELHTIIDFLSIRNAAIAQLVEHDLAKVGVASSSLVCRSFLA